MEDNPLHNRKNKKDSGSSNDNNPLHTRIEIHGNDNDFFISYKVIDDWKIELNRLIDEKSDNVDNVVNDYLPYYAYVIKLCSSKKFIGFTLLLTLYVFIIGFLFADNSSFRPALHVFNVIDLLLGLVTLFNMRITKRNLFGRLLRYNSDIEVGYYELLNAQLKYLTSSEIERSKHSTSRQYVWLSFIFIMFPIGIFFIVVLNQDQGTYGFRIRQIALLGYFLNVLACGLNILQAIMTVASAIHGSFSLMDLCDAWISLFLRYKKYSTSSFNQLLDNVNKNRQVPLSVSKVRKDVFERYLLIVGILTKTSSIWNLTLSCYIIACICSFFVIAYLAFTTSHPIFYYFEAIILIFAFMLVSSISFANSAVAILKDSIQRSIPFLDDDDNGDFNVLGGRELWLKYLDEVPCYWTVYGFALTPKWLQGFITGALATIIISVIPALTSSIG